MAMQEKRITFTLNRLVYLLNSHADAILRERFNLTYSQFIFLLTLQGEAVSLTDAAQRQGVSLAAVSKRVPWFVDRGLIVSKGDADHGRRVLISLTPKGHRLIDKASADLEKAFRSKFELLEGIDLNSLNTTLNDVIHQLDTPAKEH